MPWSRPPDVPVGRVWSRFSRRDENGCPGTKYQIKDVESFERKRCLDMMERVFLKDEPLCQILDIQADIESVTTIRSNWERYADQGICVACYTEENEAPQDLVGFNVLLVRTTDDGDEDIEKVVGEPWKKLLKTLVTAENLVDVFQLYNVDKYLTCSGLVVQPQYRGQNIGAEIIAVREIICKSLSIEATASVFTARGSQNLAAKCDYQKLAELPYEEMLKQGVDLNGCSTPSAILMGRSFDINADMNNL